MSRTASSRRLGRGLRRLAAAVSQWNERRRQSHPPLFEVAPLERRMYLSISVTPSIYAVASAPNTSRAVTVYFNPTGTQASQVNSVTLNLGDYLANGSPGN